MLRIYDKSIESGGKTESVRWELVLRDEAAQAVQRELATTAWAPLFNSQLARFVDFREPDSSERAARRERMPWCDAIVGDVTKAPPYMPRPVYSAEKSMAHFERNQAPVLAALMQNQGGDTAWFYRGIREGRRWKQKHAIIARRDDHSTPDDG
jgi:hypothetical protein